MGTGNYNEKTARMYTDLSLMTADPSIGLEAAAVFQALSKGETLDSVHHLLVAPKCLQNRVLELIDREIQYARQGEAAYIGVKINSLTDKIIIGRLIDAAGRGEGSTGRRGICACCPVLRGPRRTSGSSASWALSGALPHLYLRDGRAAERVHRFR